MFCWLAVVLGGKHTDELLTWFEAEAPSWVPEDKASSFGATGGGGEGAETSETLDSVDDIVVDETGTEGAEVGRGSTLFGNASCSDRGKLLDLSLPELLRVLATKSGSGDIVNPPISPKMTKYSWFKLKENNYSK